MSHGDTPQFCRVLRWNSLYTLACGCGLILGGRALALPFGIQDVWMLWGVGAGLVAVAGLMWIIAQRSRPAEAMIMTLGDLGYIVASAVLVLAFPDALTPLGKIAVLAIASGVAAFVTVQALGIWHYHRQKRVMSSPQSKAKRRTDAQPFHGRRVIITGASEGIGRELAIQLASQGAQLALAARSRDVLETLAATCRERGGSACVIPTDVAVPAQCKALIERAAEELGGIDVLINNAGISMYSRFDELKDLGGFEKLLHVNYLGAVHCTYHALPHLKTSRGLLVAISSLQGKFGFPGSTGYAASKHALQGFCDSLRMELDGCGVDVLVVSPGPVATRIHTHRLDAHGEFSSESPRGSDGQSMPVEECTRQILEAASLRRRELIMTLQGRLALWLRLIAPGWLDRLVQRSVDRFYDSPETARQSFVGADREPTAARQR